MVLAQMPSNFGASPDYQQIVTLDELHTLSLHLQKLCKSQVAESYVQKVCT
uniref:AlNc14C2G259 protein n=1 Tax=Albugo laibachii Nc14 TaxID=890382 RepID=F0VZC1_9STRA|nr:AlNc14C2G259 [Albugo laibachii Nc14]|eukprot:CCA14151.1 AlNc14C2G259 [Albugo laibachii Nc14]